MKYLLILSDYNETCNCLDRFSKYPQISNFLKICPVGAELFHADRQYDETNSRFSQFYKRVIK